MQWLHLEPEAVARELSGSGPVPSYILLFGGMRRWSAQVRPKDTALHSLVESAWVHMHPTVEHS